MHNSMVSGLIKNLYQVVTQNDKRRFTLSEDSAKIQADQGHSIKIAKE